MMDIFEQKKTWENIARISDFNHNFAEELKSIPSVQDVRLLGTILALELKTGEGNTYFSSIRDKAYDFFLENGLLIRPLGNVIFLNPPYCISDDQLRYAADRILQFSKSI